MILAAQLGYSSAFGAVKLGARRALQFAVAALRIPRGLKDGVNRHVADG